MAKKGKAEPTGKPEPAVQIIEVYRDYEPPLNVMAITQRLMKYVPPQYLHGLDRIVLTNSAALPRKLRRGKIGSRKRKLKIDEIGGQYHPKTNNRPAWIDIFVDNLRPYEERAFRIIPYIRDFTLAEVLYHEIGHHIHYTLRREHRERENVAEEWGQRLTNHYIGKKYRHLVLLMRAIRHIMRAKWFQRVFPRLSARLKRAFSQAQR
jgi:hypothetical protein